MRLFRHFSGPDLPLLKPDRAIFTGINKIELVFPSTPYHSLEEKRKQSLKRADSGTGPYADLMRYGMILYQAGSIRIPDSL
jgi:hypothetical protein